MRCLNVIAFLCLFCGVATLNDALAEPAAALHEYVIEREIPGAGKMTPAELKAAAAKSNKVLASLGPDIKWVQSYVTGDKLYCVYQARNEEIIRKHAEVSGFPASRITAVKTVIGPDTGKPDSSH
jgi:hypothetical protein